MKCPRGTASGLFKQLGSVMLMLWNTEEPRVAFTQRVEAALEVIYAQHADQDKFIKYFKTTWGGKLGKPEHCILSSFWTS